MSFTYATAITRLDGGMVPAFKAAATSGQKLYRLNEVLERFFEFGRWRGVYDTAVVTQTAGIITISATYQNMEALAVTLSGNERKVPIKSMEWPYMPGGPGLVPFDQYGDIVAIDKGDVSGTRKYQLTGDQTYLDTLTFSALLRKRYTWTATDSDTVPIDSFQALRMGVLALGFEDVSDYDRSTSMFNAALAVLNGNLEQFNAVESYGVITTDPNVGIGHASNLV